MTERASTARGEFSGTRWLGVLAGIALLCRLALDENLSWVVFLLAGIAMVVLSVIRWPYGALAILIASSAMPRFFVELFGWKARPEHFAAAIVFMAATMWLITHKQRIRIDALGYCILAYIGVNYVSSAFTSSEPSSTLRWALLNNLAVLPYFLIRFLVRDLGTLRRAFRIFLVVAVVESSYGILCYASHQVFRTTAGMEAGLYFVDIAAPYGSLYEPNLFGAYAACSAVLFLSLYLGKASHRSAYMMGFIITLFAAVLSFSRAALIALVVAGVWAFWKSRQHKNSRSRKLIILVPAISLVLIVAATTFRGVLQERLVNLFTEGLAEDTAVTPYILIAEPLQGVPNTPLLGSGTARFQLSFDWAKYVPQWAGNATWVGNVTVRILHDAGLLGLTALMGFLTCLWWRIRTGLRGNRELPMLIGLSGGALVYGISFQSTDGTTLAFPWVYLGLLAAAATILRGYSQESH